MHKAGVFLLILLMGFPILLAAQDDDDYEWDYYDDLYAIGDQTFIITLGTILPMFMQINGETAPNKYTPPVGGAGSLCYNYYLNANIFAGAEVSAMFIGTLGSNTLFMLPVGIRGGYQFNIWKMEIPISIGVGMVWHRFIDQGYYGMYLKGGVSAFYRATTTWSFGINSNWYWFPQWVEDKTKNAYGNFLDLTISARYHF
ncbi:MAG: hypothetical protein FWC19_04200 [Treponema sp.]|nr:hypothetical protein [Treponema sp.]MCL2271994.1 hypothetical protein [Treponema sp.]